jgi:arylsulfatase
MGRPRFVVLLVVDCLRADHLGYGGYSRDTSPTVDSLAEEGVWFESCYPQGIYTFASHVSLLTSIHHVSHQLRNGDIFAYKVKTLADYMRDAGYVTAAFVSNGVIAGDLGFGERFDSYDDGLDCKQNKAFSRDAQNTTKAVVDWLEREKPTKGFLFIHFNDCHPPYIVPQPYSELYVGDHFYAGDKRLPIRPGGGRGAIYPQYAIEDRQEVDFYVSQYDAAIRYVDDHIRIICERLSLNGSLEDSLMILTGDHGEGMGEHDIYFTHGKAFYQEFLGVPLVIAGRDIPKGRVVSQPVRHIDVLPTVLRLLGISEVPDYVQGVSLGPLLEDRMEQARDLDIFDVVDKSAYIRDGRWKYIVKNDYSLLRPKRGAAEAKRWAARLLCRPHEELFDLQDDPAESNNRIRCNALQADILSRKLKDLTVRYRAIDLERDDWTCGAQADREQIEERLRALGYVD